MALSRVKNWVAAEVLTASDLNAEFNNILNNAISLISPLTANLNFNNFQGTNFRFEVQTATQTAANSGRAYFQSTEGNVHVDTGTVITRSPALSNFREGRLVGMVNTTGVSGATTYSDISLGTGLTMNVTTGVLTGSAAATGGNPLQSAVFN